MTGQDRPRGATRGQEQAYWEGRLEDGDLTIDERMQVKIRLAELEQELNDNP